MQNPVNSRKSARKGIHFSSQNNIQNKSHNEGLMRQKKI